MRDPFDDLLAQGYLRKVEPTNTRPDMASLPPALASEEHANPWTIYEY
jgi:hypothetical protein